MSDATFLQLRDILAEILVLNPEAIQRTSRMTDDLDADSIAFLELNYRLKENFGVDVPDPKVNEETLSMPIFDGLEQLERTPGGVTLFDYLRDGVVAADAADDRAAAVVAEAVLDGFADVEFHAEFVSAMGAASMNEGRAQVFVELLAHLRALPGVGARLEELARDDPEWQTDESRLFAAAGRETTRGERTDLLRNWREAMNDHHARRLLDRVNVAQLARMLGCAPPRGLSAEAMVTSLRLKDLLRFITVDSYVRYVTFLQGVPRRLR